MNSTTVKELDSGNYGIVGFRREAAYVKDMGPRPGTGFMAGGVGAGVSDAPGYPFGIY